jgi:hypothetical protein
MDGRRGLQHCQEERLVLALGHGQAHGVQEHGETMRRRPRQRSSSHIFEEEQLGNEILLEGRDVIKVEDSYLDVYLAFPKRSDPDADLKLKMTHFKDQYVKARLIFVSFSTVLRILEILVRIWIRTRGSISLTNGSGSGCRSGSGYFHRRPSRHQQKINFGFLLITL